MVVPRGYRKKDSSVLVSLEMTNVYTCLFMFLTPTLQYMLLRVLGSGPGPKGDIILEVAAIVFKLGCPAYVFLLRSFVVTLNSDTLDILVLWGADTEQQLTRALIPDEIRNDRNGA